MSNLNETIETLAAEFATKMLEALRRASLAELIGETGSGAGPSVVRSSRATSAPAESRPATNKSSNNRSSQRRAGGRLGRRSVEDIGGMLDKVVALLAQAPEGMRAEQIRQSLGVQAKELPRPLADGLAAGKLRKSGQKRATTYFIGDGGKKGSAAQPAGAKKKLASRKE